MGRARDEPQTSVKWRAIGWDVALGGAEAAVGVRVDVDADQDSAAHSVDGVNG